jgi:hypothetical protein
MTGIPEATAIFLTGEERAELSALARSTKTEHRLRQRARIVLLAADGLATRAIGREVGCTTGNIAPRPNPNAKVEKEVSQSCIYDDGLVHLIPRGQGCRDGARSFRTLSATITAPPLAFQKDGKDRGWRGIEYPSPSRAERLRF